MNTDSGPVEKTGMSMRLSVPVGSSTTRRRVWLSLKLPEETSTIPTKPGPSFFISQTTGNQLASGTDSVITKKNVKLQDGAGRHCAQNEKHNQEKHGFSSFALPA